MRNAALLHSLGLCGEDDLSVEKVEGLIQYCELCQLST